MYNSDYDTVIYFRSINAFNQKVFPVPIPFMSRMSPKQLLIMGIAMLVGYVAYVVPAWHLAVVSILLVYVAAKERKVLYPERHALAIFLFLVRRYITKAPTSAIERSKREERRRKHGSQKPDTGLYTIPQKFAAGSSATGPLAAQAPPRRVYTAKLGTPITLEVTLYDAAGRLYPRTRADALFDGQHYAVVSDSAGQFEIYPIISEFGRKDLVVSVEDRRVLSESFDIQKG